MQIRKTMFKIPAKAKRSDRKKLCPNKQLSPGPKINPFDCLSPREILNDVKSLSPRDSKLPKLRATSPSAKLLPSCQKRSYTLIAPFNLISLKILPKHISIPCQPSRTPTFHDPNE